MKKLLSCALALILVFAACVSLVSCGEIEAEPFEADVSVDTEGHALHYVEIKIKGYGTVSVTLDETVAPITVQNFLSLANNGYLNGTPFIRMQEGFVLQSGDASMSKTIKGEFNSNGWKNELSHKKGVLSMARTNDPDSASSQFFVMIDDYTGLDGEYAAFGWVTAGMNVIEALCADIKSTDFTEDYNGIYMGFLKESAYPIMESVTVVGNNGVEYKEPTPVDKNLPSEPFQAEVSVNTDGHTLHNVAIKIKYYGTVNLTLDETVAPITVQNFLKIARSGAYNGKTFLRLQHGFVIQGGAGASSETIKGEFSSNGIENNLLHKKGIISMARATNKNSATCQFFIMLDKSADLDGDYAAFGWVTSGMNIIEEISKDITKADYMNSSGFLYEYAQPIIESVTIIE